MPRVVRYRDRRRDEGEPVFLKEARRHTCTLPAAGHEQRIAAHAARVRADMRRIEEKRREILMTPEPLRHGPRVALLRLKIARLLATDGEPMTRPQICRETGLGLGDVHQATYGSPWFRVDRGFVTLTFDGLEAAQQSGPAEPERRPAPTPDPLAGVRRAVAGCRNIATAAEALAHARAYHEAPADEPIRVRVAE